MKKRTNILVMRYRFIGDMVLTVPFLKNLRAAYPEARIDMLIEPLSGQILKGCPYIDSFIDLDVKTIHKYSEGEKKGKIAGYIELIRLLRKKGYDTVFVLKRSLSSAVIAKLLGARERIGFDTEHRGWLLTKRVKYRDDTQHEVENFLDVLKAAGIPVGDTTLELWPARQEKKRAAGYLKDAGVKRSDLKIVIHPVASLPAKEWPLDNCVRFCKKLLERYDVKLIFTGAPDDAAKYNVLAKEFGDSAVNLCGRATLRECISIYRDADLFIGVDSGPMHIAAAAGTPVIALFGPVSPVKWGPWTGNKITLQADVECRPCSPHKCETNKCMLKIDADDIMSAAGKMIDRISKPAVHE